jgi:hypothetical protein
MHRCCASRGGRAERRGSVATARPGGSNARDVTTTVRYLNVKDDYLQELIERKPLTLVG